MTTPIPLREIGYGRSSPWSGGTGWWTFDDERTPELRWPLSVAVYDSMRRQDAQVASVLRAVTLPIRSTAWRMDPAGARDEVVTRIAEDLGLAIAGQTDTATPPRRTRGRFSWLEHLRLALLQLTFGHMFFEQVYGLDDVTGRVRLAKLAPRMPRTIAIVNVADDGGLTSIEQFALSSSSRPIPVSRLVAYVHDREAGNWLGTSLLRPAYKHWLIKDRLLRVQAQTIERNGMGVPLYKAQEEASPEDLAAGQVLATAWRSGDAAGAAVPYGADMILRGVEGHLPDAEPAIRYHDEQIARATLAHFLNLGTQTGSWALGATFADFFVQSLQAVAQQVADTATQHVVEDLVDANYGVDEPAPKIVFERIGSQQQATAAAIKLLLDSGALFPDRSLEQSLRQQFSLPPKDSPAPQPPAGAVP